MISNPTIVSAQNNKRPIDPNLLTFYHVVRASSPRFLLTRRIFVSPHTNKLAIRFHWKTSQDAYGHRYPNHFPRYIVCDSTWFTCFFSVSCLYHWTRSVYQKKKKKLHRSFSFSKSCFLLWHLNFRSVIMRLITCFCLLI